MASYALMKFRISNDFFDWEQAFYSAQPMARNAGIIEIFHGRTDEDPQVCMVLAQISSKGAMEEFFENAKDAVAASGHILETTEITMLNN